MRLLTGCSVEPYQSYGVLVASTKGFADESTEWYCYHWGPSCRVSDRGPVNNLGKPGSVWREVSHFFELTPSRGEIGWWSPACTFPSRLFTLTLSMGNACQPRKSLCRNAIANFNMAQNNSHTSATETPTDPHPHMLSAPMVVPSSKAGRPRKHTASWVKKAH